MSSPDSSSDDDVASDHPDSDHPDESAPSEPSGQWEPSADTPLADPADSGPQDENSTPSHGSPAPSDTTSDGSPPSATDVDGIAAGDVELDNGTSTTADVEMVAVTQTRSPKRHRRSWTQRVLLGVNCLVIVACFAGAAGLLIGRHYGNSLVRVDLAAPPTLGEQPTSPTIDPAPQDSTVQDVPPEATSPPETFPAVDPQAQNFLITGADNNACLDPESPYAAAFGDRETMGERSDTIMVMRVDTQSRRAAVLSFPRDLWVEIDGRNSSNRINTAYVRDDPQKLINTIYANFGVPINHFIQVDFCAFKVVVDAVGGVAVPFEYPARDTHTGLYVAEPGCYTFQGDHALAYVRSRHYQYFEDGEWVSDPSSDLGRISRQQDFLRRVLSSAIAKGMNPGVARGIISAAQDYVVLDRELTIDRMIEFAGVMADFQPGQIATYQIQSESETIQGNAVLIPRIKGENMQAILSIFQGFTALAAAPEQVFDTTPTTTPTTTPAPGTTGPATTVSGTTTTIVDPAAPVVTDPQQDVPGVVPNENVPC